MRTLQNVEQDLSRLAHTLPYPPTPPIAPQVLVRLRNHAVRPSRRAGWKWATVAVLILLAVLMLVPPARAAVLDIIQVGVVRILRISSPPSPATAVPVPSSQQLPEVPTTATPAATTIPSLLDLAGETTLPEAQAKLGFPLLLPGYPRDLGQPDRVFLQSMGNPMLILVWLDPDHPSRVRMSLDQIAAGNWSILKFNPPVIQRVAVNGQPGIWTEGPYLLEASDGTYVTKRMVEGHGLIWADRQITYRLETTLSLEEAIKIAESLKPATPSTPTP